MPNIFKALASITVWVLWLAGLVMGFSTLIVGTMAGHLFIATVEAPISYAIFFAVALAYAVGAVVVMRLRQKMEQ